MILWGRASSVNVQKVLWALDEFGVAYEHRIVGGKYGGLDRPEFAALTPAGRVPVLQDKPVAVWESHAILRHLARRFPEHPLGAAMAGIETAARIDPWLDFGATTLQPPFIGLFWQEVRLTPAQRDPAVGTAHRTALRAALEVLSGALADGRPMLAGADFSLADIGVGSLLYRLNDIAPDLIAPYPAVDRWHRRLAARAGYRAHVATSYDELRAGT